MYIIGDVLQNRILIAGICGWFSAQILKTIINAIVNKDFDFHRLVGDGGMPSAHSATVTAVTTMTALEHGLGSPIFAICCIFSVIVMHDAMGVRLETGKQAKGINDMIELFMDLGQPDISPEKKLKELVGHTPMQVVMGFLLGIAVAFVYYFG